MTKIPSPRPHAKRYGKLVWELNGKDIILYSDMEWHVLNAKRKELLQNPYYRRGKLQLKY
jgi:hypothetical protein